MTKQAKNPQERMADEVYKMVGAIGFLLDAYDELSRLTPGGEQKVFSRSLKYTAQRFKAELEKAERIFTHGDTPKSDLMFEQMADSYRVVDNLMTIMLEGGRKLSPEAMVIFNDDMLATAAKWGIDIRGNV